MLNSNDSKSTSGTATDAGEATIWEFFRETRFGPPYNSRTFQTYETVIRAIGIECNEYRNQLIHRRKNSY